MTPRERRDGNTILLLRRIFGRDVPGRPGRTPRTHDFTNAALGWGHDWCTLGDSAGEEINASGWGSGIEPGDYLIFSTNKKDPRSPTTRYRVKTIKYMGDPTDQWFAAVVFDPRPDEQKREEEAGELDDV